MRHENPVARDERHTEKGQSRSAKPVAAAQSQITPHQEDRSSNERQKGRDGQSDK